MIALQISLKNMIRMEKYIAQNVMKLAKLVIIQENKEIINVLHVKKVMSQVQECMQYVIKFVHLVNSFIMKTRGKKNVQIYVLMKSHIWQNQKMKINQI